MKRKFRLSPECGRYAERVDILKPLTLSVPMVNYNGSFNLDSTRTVGNSEHFQSEYSDFSVLSCNISLSIH